MKLRPNRASPTPPLLSLRHVELFDATRGSLHIVGYGDDGAPFTLLKHPLANPRRAPAGERASTSWPGSWRAHRRVLLLAALGLCSASLCFGVALGCGARRAAPRAPRACGADEAPTSSLMAASDGASDGAGDDGAAPAWRPNPSAADDAAARAPAPRSDGGPEELELAPHAAVSDEEQQQQEPYVNVDLSTEEV